MNKPDKDNESAEKSIYALGKGLSLIFIIIALLAFTILLFPFFFKDYNFDKLASLGDTASGFLNPIIGIAAALLTFLAFYIQYQANKQVERQFEKQQIDDSNTYEYTKLKERFYLIISEIDNFNVAFHEGKLISELSEIPDKLGKKYNFNGIQGLNLFLIEYFRDKREKEKNAIKKFNIDDSFHSIALSIVNLITLFYNAHTSVNNSFLVDPFKSELHELMNYLYYSKISFLVEHFNRNDPDGHISDKVKELKKYYNEKL